MSRRRRVRVVAALAAIGAVLSSAGCGSSDSNRRADGTLTYWAVSMTHTLSDDQRLRGAELAKFTRRTGVKVHLEMLTWDSLYTRIMSAVASGRQPDIVDIGNTWSATLQATGAFLPFDRSAMTAIGGRQRFVPTTLTSTGASGRPPASIPLFGQAFGLFYNKKLFAAAGIQRPPATWAEFVRDARTLTKPGQWGVSLLGASSAGNAQLAFILGRQYGAQLFDTDGRAQFASAGERDAVRRLLDLMTKEKVVNPSDAERRGLTDSLAALAHGQAAMVPFQSVGRGYFRTIGFDDYGVAPLPVISPLPPGGAPVQSTIAGTNVAVFAKTAHREAALELVRFLTSTSEQAALNKAYGTLPVVTGAYADAAFSDPITRTFGAILRDHSETMPMVPQEGKMETVLGGALSDLWAKAATAAVSEHDIATALTTATRQLAGER